MSLFRVQSVQVLVDFLLALLILFVIVVVADPLPEYRNCGLYRLHRGLFLLVAGVDRGKWCLGSFARQLVVLFLLELLLVSMPHGAGLLALYFFGNLQPALFSHLLILLNPVHHLDRVETDGVGHEIR